jgi:hypothetical protein
VINLISWQQMLLGCLIPMLIMLAILLWERLQPRYMQPSDLT